MAFKLTNYLGGKRYESKCVKCKETLIWTIGDQLPMVLFQDSQIGFLCPRCYAFARNKRTPKHVR